MADLDALLADFTRKENPKIHGALMKCVDGNGNEIYSKISGYSSIAPDAPPLPSDAVFKMASSTKIITSIALLQCIDKGLIGLDEPLTTILPELKSKEILQPDSQPGIPSKTPITARHLLSHTSGLAYFFLDPLLGAWTQSPEGKKREGAHDLADHYNVPLVFEPGSGWCYGVSLDWAGIVVRRLHNNMSLEDYLIQNIWKPVGLKAPFPTFYLSRDQNREYKERVQTGVKRNEEGGLEDFEFWHGDDKWDQPGGHGLVATAQDYLAVLSDLVSLSPKLLKAETIKLMFEPQLQEGSKAKEMLLDLRPAWDLVSGPVPGENVNHGLGGLLLGEAMEIGQPGGILAWGGGTNTVWWASRELGVAGFFGTQLFPFGDGPTKELVNAWKKDFWSQFSKKA